MQINVPFRVEYLTDEAVPLAEIIEALISAKTLIEEGSYSLPLFIPGLSIEKLEINVKQISQESPLREIFIVALYATSQKSLEESIPLLFENVTGIHVPDEFQNLFTICVMVLIFYGAAAAKDIIAGAISESSARAKLREMVAELSKLTGLPEDVVQRRLDERYKPTSRLKMLASTAIRFVLPSRKRRAPILVGDQRIEPRILSDFPDEYELDEANNTEKSEPFSGILYIHAQDRDKENSGWAAVPQGVSEKRLKMRLVDGVTADQLWNRDKVVGSGVIKYKRTGQSFVPSEIHLGRIFD